MSIIHGQFAYRIPQRMAADYSFLHMSTAFTVCALFCMVNCSGLIILPLVEVCSPRPIRVLYSSADVSGLLILADVNGLNHGFRTVLLSKW